MDQSPEQNRFYCNRNAGASDESSFQGVRIAFAPLPYHLQEKGDTKPSPPAAIKSLEATTYNQALNF